MREIIGERYITPEILVCKHHWIVEPPNGPISMGTCLNCHEIKPFKNSGAEKEDSSKDLAEARKQRALDFLMEPINNND